MLQRNIHLSVFVFIILFLLSGVYISHKIEAFLCEHVHVFVLNSVNFEF